MIGWMYAMVWESLFVFLCMMPVMWMWQHVFAGRFTPRMHRMGLWVFCLYLAGLCAVTGIYSLLFTQAAFTPYFHFVLLEDVFACPEQYLLNLLLFVPMGFLIPLLWKENRVEQRVIWIGFLCSLSIELMQMFCGRTSDVDDLLMNTLGTLFGYWMFLAAEQQTAYCLWKRRERQTTGSVVSEVFRRLAYEG